MVRIKSLRGEKAERNRRYIFLLLFSVFISLVAGTELFDRVSVILILYVCIRLGMDEECPVNPYYLFTVTPLSLLVYFNLGSTFMTDLTHETWLLGIINMAAFLIALIKVPAFKRLSNCKGPRYKSSLFHHSLLLFILSFVGRLIPQLSSILWIFAVPAIACAIKSKEMRSYILVMVYAILSLSTGYISKLMLLMLMMTFLICYDKYYAHTIRQKRRLLLLSSVGVIVMVFAFSFANKERGQYDADEGLDYYNSQGLTWNYDAEGFLPYMYLTNGWTNLQFVTQTQTERTYGLWFFKPLLGYAQMDSYFENEYKLESYSSFNTFGFITCGYKDFGFWLSVISALFLGFFVKKIYTRYLISRSPFDVGCYVLIGLATLNMFFSNHFFMQSYPFTIVIEMELYKLLCDKMLIIDIDN